MFSRFIYICISLAGDLITLWFAMRSSQPATNRVWTAYFELGLLIPANIHNLIFVYIEEKKCELTFLTLLIFVWTSDLLRNKIFAIAMLQTARHFLLHLCSSQSSLFVEIRSPSKIIGGCGQIEGLIDVAQMLHSYSTASRICLIVSGNASVSSILIFTSNSQSKSRPL